MIIVDSGEKSDDLFFALNESGYKYRKERINFCHCQKCGTVYLEKPDTCECGSSNLVVEDVADFTNDERTFIAERKSENDLWGSMVDKSLYEQFEKMAKYFKGVKVLLLEGFLSNVVLEHPTKRNWIESIPATAMQYGISFLQCDDAIGLVEQVHWLDKKSGKTPKTYMKIDDKYKGMDDQLKLLCKLIDIGEKKGKVLLDYFRSPITVFNAILNTEIIYTSGGNPKGLVGPFSHLKGFGTKFIEKNKHLLTNESC